MNNDAVMDQRVKEVLKGLEAGNSREEISKRYDYSSHRSLDQYMRRRNFHWNGDNQMYEPVENDTEVKKKDTTTITDGKILRILASFDTEYPNPKKIAEDLEFENYDALTNYMLKKNFRWDSGKKSYVKSEETIQSNADVGIDEDVDVGIDGKTKNEFIDYLYDNRKVIKRLISNNMRGKDLPNYLVTGDTSTKTIYMSTKLSALMKEYSDEKNISQRQVVESALIEFLKTYGFRKEIDHLIKK